MELFEIIKNAPENSQLITDSIVITHAKLKQYDKILCSVSGGSDSDILVDLCQKFDDADKITYAFFDTAIPLAAGMSVNVTIDYEAGGDNLTVVPLSAIFQDKEKSSVWVYRPADKKVTQRQVKIRQILKEGNVGKILVVPCFM